MGVAWVPRHGSRGGVPWVPCPERAAAGVETRSIDETTGVQALERAAPTRAMAPGRCERTEYEYIRHGTTTLIADFDGATATVNDRLRPTLADQSGGETWRSQRPGAFCGS